MPRRGVKSGLEDENWKSLKIYENNIEYREKYERQWDPTFNSGGDDDNEIRDFIRNFFVKLKDF